jgi:hypothetical protein
LRSICDFTCLFLPGKISLKVAYHNPGTGTFSNQMRDHSLNRAEGTYLSICSIELIEPSSWRTTLTYGTCTHTSPELEVFLWCLNYKARKLQCEKIGGCESASWHSMLIESRTVVSLPLGMMERNSHGPY